MSSLIEKRISDSIARPNGVANKVPVSVVIPCYRCAGTIQRAIKSVFVQTSRPLHVIMVEDASGDDTLHQLHQIQEAYGKDWVELIALPANVGAGEARNIGWGKARHEWVAFLDADDTWHPRKIEIQYNFVRANPRFAIAAHRHLLLQSFNKSTDPKIQEGYIEIRWLGLLLSNRFITPSVMLRRDLPFRFPSGKRYMEDHFLWLQSAAEGYQIARLNAELALIHKQPFGQSGLSSHLIAMEMDELDNYRRLYHMRKIGRVAVVLLLYYSMLKFARRCAITTIMARRPILKGGIAIQQNRC